MTPAVTIDRYDARLLGGQPWRMHCHDRAEGGTGLEVEVALEPLADRAWSLHVRMTTSAGSDRSGRIRRIEWP